MLEEPVTLLRAPVTLLRAPLILQRPPLILQRPLALIRPDPPRVLSAPYNTPTDTMASSTDITRPSNTRWRTLLPRAPVDE